jgi:hypothetical protein
MKSKNARERGNFVAPPALTIDRRALAELHKIALSLHMDQGDLSYREIQQLLTLKALAAYFESYGLQAPFELKVNPTDV